MRLYAASFCTLAMWAALRHGRRTTRPAPSSARPRISASGPPLLSSAPPTKSVGARMRPSSSSRSRPTNAAHAAEVAVEAGAAHHRAHAIDHVGMRRLEVVGEPALRRLLDDGLDATGLHRLGESLRPHHGELGNHARAAAARHELRRCARDGRSPCASRPCLPSPRPTRCERADAERVPQRDEVGRERLDRVRRRRRLGLSLPAQVVAQHAEAIGEARPPGRRTASCRWRCR